MFVSNVAIARTIHLLSSDTCYVNYTLMLKDLLYFFCLWCICSLYSFNNVSIKKRVILKKWFFIQHTCNILYQSLEHVFSASTCTICRHIKNGTVTRLRHFYYWLFTEHLNRTEIMISIHLIQNISFESLDWQIVIDEFFVVKSLKRTR